MTEILFARQSDIAALTAGFAGTLNTEVLFNNAGVLSGDLGFTYAGAGGPITITGNLVSLNGMIQLGPDVNGGNAAGWINTQLQGSGVSFSFAKTRQSTTANRWDFLDVGGLTGDSAGAFWHGFHFAGPTITDPTGGGNLFPRTSVYFEYNTLSQPPTRNFVMDIANVSQTALHTLRFRQQGNDMLTVTPPNSWVNYFDIQPSTTGNTPFLAAKGTDTNVNVGIAPKGTGGLYVFSNGQQALFVNNPVVNSVNSIGIAGAITGNSPTITAGGSDTNVGMTFLTKGSGGFLAQNTNANGFTSFVFTNTSAGTSSAGFIVSTGVANSGIYLISGGTNGNIHWDSSVTTFSIGQASNAMLSFLPTTSAVNGFSITDATTGNGPLFASTGTDTNIAIRINAKGNAGIFLQGGGSTGFFVNAAVNAVNYIQALGTTTGNTPSFNATGSDTNIGMSFVAKGSQAVSFFNGGVNSSFISGSTTGNPIIFQVQGSDTNIQLNLSSKGTGAVQLTSDGNAAFSAQNISASTVNWIVASGSTTGNSPSFSSTGTDTNIGINLATKGTGPLTVASSGNGNIFSVTPISGTNANYVGVLAALTTNAPAVQALGSDTNVALILATQGHANLVVNSGGNGTFFQAVSAASGTNTNSITVQATNTTVAPSVNAVGGDTNVSLNLTAKGTGSVALLSNGNTVAFFNNSSASAVNNFLIGGSATGIAPSILAQGTDTNIGISVTAKGTGQIFMGSGVLLSAGTTTLKPLNFQSGTNLTTAAAGVMEYDGTAFYATALASSRQVMDTEQVITLTAAYTLTSQTAAQKLFNATANGALTVAASTTYLFECAFALSSMSASSGSFGFAFGGTATLTSQQWQATAVMLATSLATPLSPQMSWNTAANTSLATASTGTFGTAYIKGKLRVNASGTLIPQVSLTVAAAAIVATDSYFRIWPLGTSSVTNVGNWS